MNKKFLYGICSILALITIANAPANAMITIAQANEPVKVSTEVTELKTDEEKAIKRVSLRERLQRTPEAQINSFYKKCTKIFFYAPDQSSSSCSFFTASRIFLKSIAFVIFHLK